MATYHLPRLTLDLHGVDPARAQAALDALPAALSAALAAAGSTGPGTRPAGARDRGAPAQPIRFDAPPSAEALANAIAARIAGAVQGAGRRPAGSAGPPGPSGARAERGGAAGRRAGP